MRSSYLSTYITFGIIDNFDHNQVGKKNVAMLTKVKRSVHVCLIITIYWYALLSGFIYTWTCAFNSNEGGYSCSVLQGLNKSPLIISM